MSRRTPSKKAARKSRAWKKGMGPGTYDFGKGEFTPAAPAAADPPEAAPEPTTRIHGVPGRDEPVVFTGDDAMPGFADLSFQELAQLAGMAGVPTPPGTGEVLEGVVLKEEVAAAKKLLADAEERGESALDLAHAYAYLDQVHKAIGRHVKRTREHAERLFAAAQLVHGMKSLDVMADDGGPAVATIHLQEPAPQITWNMEAVVAFCEKHATTELCQQVLPGAFSLPDVVAYIAMTHPDYVKTHVQEAYLTRLQSEIDEQGRKADPTTGELVQLATITPGKRKGAFITRYATAKNGRPSGKERIEAMYRAGAMGDVLALGPAPEPAPDEPAAQED
ncbi:hypothetical protein [Streptosporangium sp. NPDC002721]|uniref:hypothetical protein n=1 Tax=Streptosporangium sp. NPDC002721 TaxID=3366188 RepID=UPI0036992CBA